MVCPTYYFGPVDNLTVAAPDVEPALAAAAKARQQNLMVVGNAPL
jgi:hypothetical protein